MSQTTTTTHTPADRGDWERVLAQLRAEGFSPVESIKITRAVLRVSLGEAKRLVHMSRAWADRRADFEQLHDLAASTLGDS
jgi:ribosomal protein L7/L12